jgi:hypothetical protein
MIIAKQWRWTEQKALKLRDDLRKYHQCKSPFGGGKRDAREWWKAIPRDGHDGSRTLAIALASVVPHSADVEHLFSDLGGTQSPRRSPLSVDSMEKSGKIRSRLTYELQDRARVAGRAKHRKHNHMHTSDEPGIDADLAKDLENPMTWIPPLDGADEENIVEKAYQDLEKTLNDEVPAPPSEGSIVRGELINFAELD